MTTSRDEALKLARMHVSGEAYGRLVAGCCVIANRIEEISDAWRKEWQRRG